MEEIKFYRYTLNYEWEDQTRHLSLDEFIVISETKKWYWIWYWVTKYKWVRKDKTCWKQFAWDTKEKAMSDFIRRTQKRIGWYKYFLEECNEWIKIADKCKNDKTLFEKSSI